MTSWIVAAAFIATNVDDLFLLPFWFVKRSRFATVLLGQVVGFSAIVFLSLVGYWGLRLLPQSAVHWFGLAPVAIGIKQLLSATDRDSRNQAESAWEHRNHHVRKLLRQSRCLHTLVRKIFALASRLDRNHVLLAPV